MKYITMLLCVSYFITTILSAPQYENLRDKKIKRMRLQDPSDKLPDTKRTRRQDWNTLKQFNKDDEISQENSETSDSRFSQQSYFKKQSPSSFESGPPNDRNPPHYDDIQTSYFDHYDRPLRPPPPLSYDRGPPPPPHHDRGPPPPPHHDRRLPPPPHHDRGPPPPPHHDRGPPPPPPPPHHDRGPPYYSNSYLASHNEDRQTRQSSQYDYYKRPPEGRRPPPPPPYDDRPPHHDARPPPPPPRHDYRPPPPPPRYDDRPPPPPPRYDDRPPHHNRHPPPPPPARSPPHFNEKSSDRNRPYDSGRSDRERRPPPRYDPSYNTNSQSQYEDYNRPPSRDRDSIYINNESNQYARYENEATRPVEIITQTPRDINDHQNNNARYRFQDTTEKQNAEYSIDLRFASDEDMSPNLNSMTTFRSRLLGDSEKPNKNFSYSNQTPRPLSSLFQVVPVTPES